METEHKKNSPFVPVPNSGTIVPKTAPVLETGEAEPVAEIVSKFGDPEAFGERELIARRDIQKFPYGTKLYASPPSLPAPDERLERLVKALEEIAEDTRRCDHDMGFDREIGPLGCSLGDKCVCMHIHMTATVALAAVKEARE